MTEQPTQEQIREFWEWVFGKDSIQSGETIDGSLAIYRVTNRWIPQDEEYAIEFLGYATSTINLNTLDKYAVPKLVALGYDDIKVQFVREADGHHASLFRNRIGQVANSETPALALFWAIWKVKEWR